MGIKDWPGGVIRKTPVTPSGNYSWSSASGVWTPEQVDYWVKQGGWPTAGNFPTYMYVAAKADNTVYYSLDGTTWTSMGVVSGFNGNISKIKYSNGNIVLFDVYLGTRHSKNLGASWSTFQALGGGTYSYALAIDPTGQYIVNGTDGGIINYSTDYGDTYTTAAVAGTNVYSVIYGNGYFLYGAYNTGIVWRANYNTPATVTQVGSSGVPYDGGSYDPITSTFWIPPGASNTGGRKSTNNGTSWTANAFPTAYQYVAAYNSILVSFRVYPTTTTLNYSTNNGSSFSSVTPGGTIYSVDVANGVFLIGTSTGLYTSTNGSTWTQRISGDFRAVGAGK